MPYRILIDENTSPVVAELLRDEGHEALHVSWALEFGASDERIADYALTEGFVILTHDDDFLRPDVASDVPVLYYADDTLAVTRRSPHASTRSRRLSRIPPICRP